ncbi:MAG TPA: hypothetical protein VHG90_09855 [Acidimicrobiales bacterium]|nr:hypothetical protein [Acidimicrobiales bacterium]
MDDPVAAACNLSEADLRRRGRDWRAVIDEALVEKHPVPGGARLTFRPRRSVVDDLVELVHAERACCGWASWTLTSTADAAVVDVTAEGERAQTVRSLFGVG